MAVQRPQGVGSEHPRAGRRERPDDGALDADVLEEIELATEAMIAANAADGRLAGEDVDRALQVRDRGD